MCNDRDSKRNNENDKLHYTFIIPKFSTGISTGDR